MLLVDGTAVIVYGEVDGEDRYLSRFWDISNNMWTHDWRQAQFFETQDEANRAMKQLERFGVDMNSEVVTLIKS